jgi:hypothetical protein
MARRDVLCGGDDSAVAGDGARAVLQLKDGEGLRRGSQLKMKGAWSGAH